MPQTNVKLPDGRVITINHPEGATATEISNYAMSQYKPSQSTNQKRDEADGSESYLSKVGTDIKRVVLDTQRDLVNIADLLPGDTFGLDSLSRYERDKEISKLAGFGYLDTSEDIDPVTGKIKAPETAVGVGASILPYILGGGAVAKVGTKAAARLAPNMRKLPTATKYTLAGAAASQVLSDPDENLFNVVSDAFPEGTEDTILQYLSADENDSETSKRMKLLIGDLGAGFVLDGLMRLAPSLKNMATAKAPTVNNVMAIASETRKVTQRARRGEAALASAKEEVFPFRADLPSAKESLTETPEGLRQIEKQRLDNKEGLRDRVKTHLYRAKNQVFTSKGYASETMFKAFNQSQSNQASLITEAQNIGNRLNVSFKSIADGTVEEVQDKAQELLTSDLSKYFKLDIDDQAAMLAKDADIPESTAEAILDGRELIDRLSTLLAGSKGISSDVSEKIMDNMGVYLKRSYLAFKDPKKFVVDEGQKEEVVKRIAGEKIEAALEKGNTLSIEKARERATREIDKLLAKTDKEQIDYFTQARRVAKFHQKKKVPDDIRELLGEIKDPADNLIISVSDAARVYETNNFYQMLSEMGKNGKYIVGKTTKAAKERGFTSTIKSTNTNLDGKVTTPEVIKVLEQSEEMFDFMRSQGNAVKGYKTYLQFKGLGQASKTIYSLPTAIRNVVGGFQFGVANGDLSAFNPLSSNRGHWNIIANKIARGGDKALDTEYEKLVRLGVINTSVNVNMFRELIQIGTSNHGKVTIAERLANNKVLKAAEDVYMGTDDYFKISNYTSELETLKKARPGVADDLLEQEAADIVGNTFPNYNRVPKALKRLTYTPIGNFIAFPAEIIRTSAHIVRQASKEINSGNTVLRNRGLRRLSGFTATTVGMGEASKLSADLMGWTEEERKFNTILAEGKYDENANFIWYRDSNGETRKVSTKYLDSYNTIKEPVLKVLDRIADGELKGEQLDEYLLKAGFEGSKVLLSPFISESIGTKAIMDIYTAWSSEDGRTKDGKLMFAPSMSVGDKLFEGFSTLYAAVEPGTITGLRKLTDDIDPYTGKEDDKIGPVSIPAAAALFGFKSSPYDPDAQLKFSLMDYNRKVRSNDTLPIKVGKDNKLSIVDKYIARQSKMYEYQQKLFKTVNAYQAIYGSYQTRRALKDIGMTGPSIQEIMSGRFKPNKPPTVEGRVLDAFKASLDVPNSVYLEKHLFNRDLKEVFRGLGGLTLYGESTINPFEIDEEVEERLEKAVGGEVAVPNAPAEPDERINKLTGLPYNQEAGASYMDEEDQSEKILRQGFEGGGKVLNKLKGKCS